MVGIMRKKHAVYLPIKKRLIRSYLKIVVIPILVLLLLLSGLSIYSITSNAVQAGQSTHQQIMLNVQSTVDALTAMMNYAVLDKSLLDILDKDYTQYGAREFLEKYHDENTITTSLLRIYHMNNAIHSVVIDPENNDTIYLAGLLPTVRNHRFHEDAWYRDILAAKGKIIVSDVHPNYISSDGQPACITIGRCIVDPMNHDNLLGVMMINIDRDALTKLWGDGQITPGSFTVLMDNSGNLIRRDDMQVSDDDLLKAVDETGNQDDGISILPVAGNLHLVLSSRSSLGWRVVSWIPVSELLFAGNALLLAVFLIVLFLSIVLFVMSRQLSERITAPVEQLSQTMRQFEAGDFQVHANEGPDEIGNLGRTFNHMTTRIRRLIKTIHSEEQEKRRHELLALQSQIHPHFLYNTLDSIKTVATLQGAGKLAQVTDSLVQFLRLCSRIQTDQVILTEELMMVEKYIDIMNFRYFEAISYQIRVPEEYRRCILPRFVLQPIVENAIIHGFDFAREKARILLQVFERDGTLVIYVTDNGKGIPSKQLQDINEKLRKGEGESKKIGLDNINRRIRLTYGKDYGIQVRSRAGCYTAVEFVLPLNRKMERDEKNNHFDR